MDAWAGDESAFNVADIEDARTRIMTSITQRRGQREFRESLIVAYDKQCAITGCSVLDVLEAAHIHPYRGPETNKVVNGLLLRGDLHTLFDFRLIAVDAETMTVIVAPQLQSSEYGAFHGRPVRRPPDPAQQPSRDALLKHREETGL